MMPLPILLGLVPGSGEGKVDGDVVFVYWLLVSSSFSLLSCLSPFLGFFFPVVQCWCGCDGEWHWLLDEADDELTMVLAVLVRLSPLLFSFLCRSPLVFPPVSPPFHRLSLAFISQRMACGATSNLVTACRGIVAVKHSP